MGRLVGHGAGKRGGVSLDFEAAFADQLGGAASGKNTDIVLDQTLGEIKEAGLIVDGDDSCAPAVIKFPLAVDLPFRILPVFFGTGSVDPIVDSIS